MSKFAAIVVFSVFSLSAFGQQVENVVRVGSVFDPTRAAVSGATVTLTPLATAAKIEVRRERRATTVVVMFSLNTIAQEVSNATVAGSVLDPSGGAISGAAIFRPRSPNIILGLLSRAGGFASDKLHVVERFEFRDAHHVRYEAQFDDPSTYTRPWTFSFDMKHAIFGESNPTKGDEHYEQWEEACYERLRPVDYSLRSERSEKSGRGENQ